MKPALQSSFVINVIVFVIDHLIVTNAQNPQAFLIEPSNKTAVLGEETVLPCRVLNRIGTIQWTRDGFGLGIDKTLVAFPRYSMIGNEVEGDYSLQIRSVTLEDDAFFQCQATAVQTVEGIRSKSAYLTVYVAPDPPVIVQSKAQGEVLRTTAGNNVELICESNGGKPTPEISWHYLNGSGVTPKNITHSMTSMSDGKRSNAQSKLLFVANKDYDNKTIVCRSINSALKEPLNATIRLDVKFAPEVQLKVIDPVGQIRDGSYAVLQCEATANPSDQLLYKWFKNDELVVGDYETKFKLESVDKSMNGAIVTCEVSNTVGQSKASHKLDIAYAPTFKPSMETVYGVDIGRDARLKCPVDGNPKPDITWHKLGKSDVLSSDQELVVKNVNEEKLGKYTCRASVKGFPEISTLMFIRINASPTVYRSYTQYGVKGGPIRINCHYESAPKPSQITWYHNRQLIIADITRGVEILEDRLSDESTFVSTLVIQKAKAEDFGDYNCSVKNQLGFDSATITIHEKMSFTDLVTLVSSLLGLLAVVVFITIVTILCLKHKHNKRLKSKKQMDLSSTSSQLTDSSDGSKESDLSTIESDSELNGIELRSPFSSMEDQVFRQNILNQQNNRFYSNEILLDYDLNRSYTQYI